MAKDKQKKKPASRTKSNKPRAKAATRPAKTASASRASKVAKVAKAAQRAGKKASDLASNPIVAEVVAATLVAAAAALKNPKKARDLAAGAADELQAASRAGVKQGNAFWQLALDVARKSIDALGAEAGGKGAPKAKPKAKSKSSAKRKATK